VNSDQSPLFVEPIVETAGGFQPPTHDTPATFTDPNNPPWGVLAAMLAWLASIAFLIFVPIITAIPYLIYSAMNGTAGRADTLLADKNFIFFSVLGVIPAHLLTLGLAWAIVTNFGRYPFWKTLGWEAAPNFGPWRSVLVAVLLLGIGFLITYIVGGKKTELDELINSSYRTRVTTAILAATTGPLVEEVVYRGVLYSAFQRAIGVAASILMVSVLFAGVHVYQYRSNAGVIAVIGLLSITLTAVRAYSGRLLPCFVIHFVFNGIQSILLVTQPIVERFQHLVPQRATPGLVLTSFLRWLS
jgi:membrane protease YdiL (CAAX protease family)